MKFSNKIYRLAAPILRALIPQSYQPEPYIRDLIKHSTGACVWQGPFKGMKYIGHSVGSTYLPKLLGSYERELHSFVEEIKSGDYDQIVNVGAAEGYYAVGLAMNDAVSEVIAYEAGEEGRKLLAELAALNDISEKVSIFGACTPETLSESMTGKNHSCIICDVEGYESELLDPEKVPALKEADLLVESHDHLCPGVTDLLLKRFLPTHNITRISQQPRQDEPFPFHNWYTRRLPTLDWVYSEGRLAEMEWLWFTR